MAQAETRFLRALALTERAASPQSPRLLPLLDNLATLYRSQQREGQARPYAERAERLREAQPQPSAS
ncbi:tetratricopeptide repeat protein [Xylophilus sp.]|uniref:tetratricopeptide repeat protein n=1 Tax=Xylophilus sp. TaxID=2653893 RepID=UPI003FCCF54F